MYMFMQSMEVLGIRWYYHCTVYLLDVDKFCLGG